MKIATAIQTVAAEVECPRCACRMLLIEGDKATCRQCAHVWNLAAGARQFRGDR